MRFQALLVRYAVQFPRVWALDIADGAGVDGGGKAGREELVAFGKDESSWGAQRDQVYRDIAIFSARFGRALEALFWQRPGYQSSISGRC